MSLDSARLMPLLEDARAALDIHLGTLIQLAPKGHYQKLKIETRKLIARIDTETGRKE